jgi:hypothetical protein
VPDANNGTAQQLWYYSWIYILSQVVETKIRIYKPIEATPRSARRHYDLRPTFQSSYVKHEFEDIEKLVNKLTHDGLSSNLYSYYSLLTRTMYTVCKYGKEWTFESSLKCVQSLKNRSLVAVRNFRNHLEEYWKTHKY